MYMICVHNDVDILFCIYTLGLQVACYNWTIVNKIAEKVVSL